MTNGAVTLDDKYDRDHGRVLLAGRQALVRLPMLQRQRDRTRGLRTAGYVTGYRGSPLGGYDSELWRVRDRLEAHDILFQPGLNEDLAATAVWGTQQLGFVPGRKVDGVFAIWYGKGPGVDRSGDPFKHANLQGVEPNGGVLLAFGDDHAGKSSTTAHQSDFALAANDIPVLYPSNVAEILTYGLAGIALSRHAGLLVALKLVNETAEATEIVDLDAIPPGFVTPEPAADAPGGVHIRLEFRAMQEQEQRIVRFKVPRAHDFVRANRLDRIAFGAERPRLALVTAGKPFADTIEALGLLGIDEKRAQELGIGIYKVAMIAPLEPTGLAEIAAGADELLFIEEKRAQMERQAASILFHLPRRVRISGKHAPDGAPLLPADMQIDSIFIADAIATRLRAAFPDLALPDLSARHAGIQARLQQAPLLVPGAFGRRPTFCAGCPHSRSTRVPDGSIGATGIGCHGMSSLLPDRNPLPLTHMGGEGAAWIGLAPFTTTEHVFQNLGDGTYSHSGSLAIRAAVQAGSNVTFKILVNDAVAMTGGQPVEGALGVGRIARQVLAEEVGRVVIVAETPERFDGTGELPHGVELHPRSELMRLQYELRATKGVTVLIFDQVCAAEKRRRRKRGLMPAAPARVFINHLVCEGCGDCSVQSSCLAIQPRATELGRKREVDQSSCNQDTSCVDGFCPSFVTIEGAQPAKPQSAPASAPGTELPEPELPLLAAPSNILLAGVGGTGIVTVSAVLGMAAHLDGLGVHQFDMTGLSQKGGAVFSHVRLLPAASPPAPARIGAGGADLLLACDLLAASQPEALRAIDAARTCIVANGDIGSTPDFHSQPDLDLDPARFENVLRQAAGGRAIHRIDATRLAVQRLGDAIGANMILAGHAWQLGRIPLRRQSIERAIELNAVAVRFNLDAFRLGREAAVHGMESLLGEPPAAPVDLDTFVAARGRDLAAYQNESYAARYDALVATARQADTQPDARFAWAVARSAYHLMAYKDEYEVARLYADGRFHAELARSFQEGGRLRVQLAPPLLARRDPLTGRPRKRSFGPWIFPAFGVLARLKALRGTAFDPFGWTAERLNERRMRDEFAARVPVLAASLDATSYERAVALAELPLSVRGFGPVKQRHVEAFWSNWLSDGAGSR